MELNGKTSRKALNKETALGMTIYIYYLMNLGGWEDMRWQSGDMSS